MHADSAETERLLGKVRQGDRRALDALFVRHQQFLERVIRLRLNPELAARVSPSDIVQETQLEACRRIHDFLDRQPMSFRLWLRKTANERIIVLQRRHIRAQRRSVAREIELSQRSAMEFARNFVDRGASPSGSNSRQELIRDVREAVAELSTRDREILLMRSVEALSNQEAAQVLGIEPVAASQRYGRALLRLRAKLIKRGVSGEDER
jgi:RNA polymerase sigma-70 factor (ECF subfamily)